MYAYNTRKNRLRTIQEAKRNLELKRKDKWLQPDKIKNYKIKDMEF